MESFFSAVLSELISRSINFIVNRCSKPPPPAAGMEESLQRALLRAQVIDEEAMGRHVTNQAMIQQLGMLRDAIHRGYYALDALRYQPHYGEDDSSDQAVGSFLPLSMVLSAKDACFSSRTAKFLEQVQEALDRLSSVIADLNELVMFLAGYPRLYRQPYSMHILLGNCMFGRQSEAEHVIKFLFHTQPPSSEELEVLPIVGPPRVGKSTLVANVCKDERVQDYFSEILWVNGYDFTDDKLACSQGNVMEHQNQGPNSDKGKRLLVVIELSRSIHEEDWNRFYLASKQSFCRGSKIVVTSRSFEIVKYGTTQALTLKHLSHEAFWYFFKTLTFGSTDPEAHPRHAQLGMEIARTQNRSIIGAYIVSHVLRNNFDINFWCKVLSFWRGSIHKHVSKFGEHPIELLDHNWPVQLGRMAAPSEYLRLSEFHHSSQAEVPEITVENALYGSIKHHGKFEVLVWRSEIPPYYSYVCTCEVQEQKGAGAKRKRSIEDAVTSC